MNRWLCEIDNCKNPADYRAKSKNHCAYHWELYLQFGSLSKTAQRMKKAFEAKKQLDF